MLKTFIYIYISFFLLVFVFLCGFQFSVVSSLENNVNGEKTTAITGGQQTSKSGQFSKLLNFSGEKPSTPILDTINYPMHMKNLSVEVQKDRWPKTKKKSLPFGFWTKTWRENIKLCNFWDCIMEISLVLC